MIRGTIGLSIIWCVTIFPVRHYESQLEWRFVATANDCITNKLEISCSHTLFRLISIRVDIFLEDKKICPINSIMQTDSTVCILMVITTIELIRLWTTVTVHCSRRNRFEFINFYDIIWIPYASFHSVVVCPSGSLKQQPPPKCDNRWYIYIYWWFMVWCRNALTSVAKDIPVEIWNKMNT